MFKPGDVIQINNSVMIIVITVTNDFYHLVFTGLSQESSNWPIEYTNRVGTLVTGIFRGIDLK